MTIIDTCLAAHAHVLNLPKVKITPRQSLSALSQGKPDLSLVNRLMRKTSASKLPSIHKGVTLPQPPKHSRTVVGGSSQISTNQLPSHSTDSSEPTQQPIRLDYTDRPSPPTPKARLYAASQAPNQSAQAHRRHMLRRLRRQMFPESENKSLQVIHRLTTIRTRTLWR